MIFYFFLSLFFLLFVPILTRVENTFSIIFYFDEIKRKNVCVCSNLKKNVFFGHNKEKSTINPLEQHQDNLCLPWAGD
jgi:hypothetical protein